MPDYLAHYFAYLIAKQSALHVRIACRNAQQFGSTVGGVLVRDQSLWKYQPAPVTEAH
jgi:hypothetical protein